MSQDELKSLLGKLHVMKDQMGVTVKDRSKKGGDNFMDIKIKFIDNYKKIKALTDERNQLTKSGTNPNRVVILNQSIRETLKTIADDFKEMKRLFQNEIHKRKTKFSDEDLSLRREILEDLGLKLEELKAMTSTGGRGAAGFIPSSKFTTSFNTFTVDGDDDDSPFGGPTGAASTSMSRPIKETELSAVERQGLAQIERNKQEEEKMLDIIGDLGSDLKEIALGLNEEVTKQGYIIDNVGKKMDDVNDKLEQTNKNLKKIRKEATRPADKFCMDITCLILLLGVLTVIYNMVKKITG